MLSTGVDLIEISRVQAVIEKYGERFLSRVFTDAELAYCRGRPPQLAARFAAKEAVSKMLGTGIQHPEGVAWRDIQIVSDERGKPSVQLSGLAAQRASQMNLIQMSISLSHTREYAIAIIVAE
jgi:holo-[acyl-carrier protein] synthase